jgi:hypothetical protein
MRAIGVLVFAGCAQVWGLEQTVEKCDGDQIHCNGVCVDPLTSGDDCGKCGMKCDASQVCANGTCAADCPIDQPRCGDTCSDPMTDLMNCGGCGNACSAGDVCVFGGCELACDATQLQAAITDPWGVRWDGLERTAAALDAAQVTCGAFGARLPSATELYRVSATQTGAVGMSFHTNYLWTGTPDDQLNQATIRLSDGATSAAAATSATPYRCVCGAALPRTFTAGHCNGDPGDGCFEINGYNVDKKDRPALRKSAALFECVNERAHIVDLAVLAEAIRGGIPGTNVFVMTADQSVYLGSTQLRWTGGASGWDPNTNVQSQDNRTPSPFRCSATKTAESPNPNPINNAFVPPLSKYKGETSDTAAAAWAAAHDACFVRGAHVPRSSELAELIQQGLPNGSNAWLWTSDQTGFDGMTQFLAEIHRWTGLDRRNNYAWTGAADGTIGWDYKTNSNAFRCIQYPIDSAYTPPTTCNGGCYIVTMPGATAATMWLDSQDRAASMLGPAFDDCRMQGGFLASERDLTEAIRQGLPNGTAAMVPPWIWTSDFAQNNITVVKWTDTEPMFGDEYSTDMTWAGPANSFRYRCMWTNELR